MKSQILFKVLYSTIIQTLRKVRGSGLWAVGYLLFPNYALHIKCSEQRSGNCAEGQAKNVRSKY